MSRRTNNRNSELLNSITAMRNRENYNSPRANDGTRAIPIPNDPNKSGKAIPIPNDYNYTGAQEFPTYDNAPPVGKTGNPDPLPFYKYQPPVGQDVINWTPRNPDPRITINEAPPVQKSYKDIFYQYDWKPEYMPPVGQEEQGMAFHAD